MENNKDEKQSIDSGKRPQSSDGNLKTKRLGMVKSCEEICKAVALDWKARGITHQVAAETLGKTKAIIDTQISGNKRFSLKMAAEFAEAFGYSTNFLVWGRGELFPTMKKENVVSFEDSSMQLDLTDMASLVHICEYLLNLSNNQYAINAWNGIMSGDFQKYYTNMQRLENNSIFNGRSQFLVAKSIAEKVKHIMDTVGRFGL